MAFVDDVHEAQTTKATVAFDVSRNPSRVRLGRKGAELLIHKAVYAGTRDVTHEMRRLMRHGVLDVPNIRKHLPKLPPSGSGG